MSQLHKIFNTKNLKNLRTWRNKIFIFPQISGFLNYGYMWVKHETYIHSFEKVVHIPNARLNVKLAFALVKIKALSNGLEECTSKGLK